MIGEPAAARPARLAFAEVALVERVEPLVASRSSVRASAGSRTSSPGRQRPAGGSVDGVEPVADARHPWRDAAVPSTASMKSSQAGKPAASQLDRRGRGSRRARGGRAAAWASPHERTAPGTVMASGPRSGSRRGRLARARPASAAAGARPDPLSAV